MTAITEANRNGATGGAETEPLSPELVLVDPQLAVVARARLVDPPLDRPPPPTRRPDLPAPATSSAPAVLPAEWLPAGWLEEAVDEPAHTSQRALTSLRRVGKPGIVAVVVVALSISFGLMLLLPRLLDGTGGSVGRSRDRSAAPEERVSLGDAPSRTTTERAGNPTPPQPPTPTESAPEQRPARPVFVWVPTAGASHYKVEFSRRGAKVFEAFPTAPRMALPVRWVYRGRRFALESGRYSWSVRPGYGPRREARYGPIVVRSTWAFLPSTSG